MSLFPMQVKLGFFLVFFYSTLSVSSGATEITAPIFTDEITGIDNFPILRAKSGHTIVLSGIERPASHGIDNHSLSQAKLWLSDHVIGQKVVIQPTGDHYDIFGRVHAFVKPIGGEWLNPKLLQLGLARVQITTGFTHHVDLLFDAESEARRKNTGLWKEKEFQTFNANNYSGPLKGYVIAKGKITQAAKRKTYLYLNFGNDWRDDFTIGIPLDDKSFDIKTMINTHTKGTKIEVRGLIENWNGPFIRLEQPEHLRIIQN